MSKKEIGIGWELNSYSGWGIFGLNLAMELSLLPDWKPLPIISSQFEVSEYSMLRRAKADERRFQKLIQSNPDKEIICDFPIIMATGTHFSKTKDNFRLKGEKELAVLFFENTYFNPELVQNAHAFEAVIAGSSWNGELLRNQGLNHVHNIFQGVDHGYYYPVEKETNEDVFKVFSGGKLEFRKGQDIVIEAFKAFHQRHPDSVLMTSWENKWLDTNFHFNTGSYVDGLPDYENQSLKLELWLLKNGLEKGSFVVYPMVSNVAMADIVREADVALFTNRAEGGTNLVAMETMACGIPCILSANTGHLDLISEGNCFSLSKQEPVSHPVSGFGTSGWGESDIEEIVEHLEYVYQNRSKAKEIGLKGAEFMQAWSWKNQTRKYVELIHSLY